MVLPRDIVSTGWPKVKAQARMCGIEYDDWQDGLGRCMLGKKADGLYAAGIGGVVISICRQVGKTFTIGTMIVMLCILSEYPLKVLWTAHRSRTSDETFKFMCSLVRKPAIARYVDGEPRRANGQQEIAFTNGSRVLFGARENGFGRGFDNVDVEVFDEAQILGERALDDMIPATNAARNPLIIYMGTPPKPSDPSEVFSGRRRDALHGDSDDTLYVEFSADRDADPGDRAQWRKANLSYPARTSESAILRMRKNLGEDSFRREGLGIWDETNTLSVIDPELWRNGEVTERADGGVTSFGLDMPPDRSALAIGACMRYADGSAHVELAEYRDTHRDGVAWAADWIKTNVSACIGWPAKAVRSLADLTVFDGWTYPNGEDVYGLDELTEPPDELKRVRPVWAPTREISDGARADAYVKISQVNQSYATSEVGLRRLGLDGDEIRSLRSQQSRDRGWGALDMILRSANAGDDQGSQPAEDEPTGGGATREA
ncbi:terminase [Bifidobacterium margollesii]|uniref:terminase n=1 Tax=Bifidobacterium margollesii TaxID=2020964 RepID=UPI0010555576|nr:terminase [Bifidobacterium margollesii]